MSEIRVRFKDRVLVDNVIENVVDQYQSRSRRRTAIILLVVVAVIAAIIIWKSMG